MFQYNKKTGLSLKKEEWKKRTTTLVNIINNSINYIPDKEVTRIELFLRVQSYL